MCLSPVHELMIHCLLCDFNTVSHVAQVQHGEIMTHQEAMARNRLHVVMWYQTDQHTVGRIDANAGSHIAGSLTVSWRALSWTICCSRTLTRALSCLRVSRSTLSVSLAWRAMASSMPATTSLCSSLHRSTTCVFHVTPTTCV